jgi:uncharacterized membrane protein/uncharacterized protein YhjY with autotransporter beta-barrel domain
MMNRIRPQKALRKKGGALLRAATALPLLFTQPAFAANGYVDFASDVTDAATWTSGALSRDGTTVVGGFQSSTDITKWDAYRWSEVSGFTTLGDAAWSRSWATGMNNDASVIVGQGHYAPADADYAWRWTLDGGMRSLGTLPGFAASGAEDVSNDGKVVVGWLQDRADLANASRTAMVWTENGGMESIGQLNGGGWSEAVGVSESGSIVAGWARDGSALDEFGQPYARAFTWTRNGMTVLPLPTGAVNTVATGISGDGRVVVGWADDPAARVNHPAMIWTPSGPVNLGSYFYGDWAEARGTNYYGNYVVGTVYTSANHSDYYKAGFIWSDDRPGGEMVPISVWLRMSGVRVRTEVTATAEDVSDDGTVVTGLLRTGSPYIARGIALPVLPITTLPDSGPSINLTAPPLSDPGSGAGGTTDPNAGTGGATDPGTANTGTDPATGDGTDPATGSGTDGTTNSGTSTDTGGTTTPDTGAGSVTDPGAGPAAGGTSDPGTIDTGSTDTTTPDASNGNATDTGSDSGTGGVIDDIGTPDGSSPDGYGIIDLVQYLATIQRQTMSTIMLRGMDMTMHGAHGSPMRIMPETGRTVAWVNGDYGRSGNAAGEGLLGSYEIGAAHGFDGDIVGRIALGRGFDRSKLDLGGTSTADGSYVLPEATVSLGGIKATVSGYAGLSRLSIDRAYVNGTETEYSHGSTDASTFAGRIRVDWLDAFRFGETAFTPYASYTTALSRVNGYSEKHGGFPARYDDQLEHFNVVRAGMDVTHALGEDVDLLGRVEASYRFEDATPETTGEIIGLNGFSIPGQPLKQVWCRAAAGVEFKAGEGTGSVMLNATTAGSDPQFWIATSWRVSF